MGSVQVIHVRPELQPNLELPRGLELVTFGIRVTDIMFGCGLHHNWSFPFTTKTFKYPRQYDSHQTCTGCGRQRFFNSKTMEHGEQFHVKV